MIKNGKVLHNKPFCVFGTVNLKINVHVNMVIHYKGYCDKPCNHGISLVTGNECGRMGTCWIY